MVLALLAWLHPAEAQEAAEPLELSLEAALELAMDNAPSLAVSAEGINYAQTQELEAFFARMPELSARSTWAPSGPVRGNAIESTSGTDIAAIGDLADELGFQTSNSIRAVLPIYTFGKIAIAEDLADVAFEAAMMEHRKAELELVFNVTQAFLGAQLALEFDDLIEEGTGLMDGAREDLENRRFDADTASERADLHNELRQLTIQEAGFAGRVADNRLLTHMSHSGLEYYCGIYDVPFVVERLPEDPPEGELDTLDRFIEIAYEYRPDLSLLDMSVIAGELSADLAWRQLVPDLFFAIGFSLSYNPLADDQPSPFANDPYNSSGLGFYAGLDWRFDFRQIARAERSSVSADRTRARQRELVGGIEIEIEQAYWEALGHQERVDAYADALRAAEALLDQRMLQEDSGIGDYDALTESLVTYFATYASYYQALFNSHLARANLALKVGLERLEIGQGLIDPDESE